MQWCRAFWLLTLLVSLYLPSVWADELPAREHERVQFLIESIRSLSGAVFIRNGEEHEPAQAAEHLAMKLQRAKNSWFAPPAEDWTAEMFIEKLASRSSLSGNAYQIRFTDGSVVGAADWLKQRLADYDAGELSRVD